MHKSVFSIVVIVLLGLSKLLGQTIDTTINNKKYPVHVVKKGETFYKIANLYKTNILEIKKLNNLDSYSLTLGQKLAIPKNEEQKIDVKEISIQKITRTPKFYTVQKGDNLYKIAKENGSSVDSIKKWSSLSSNSLNIGQELVIGFDIKKSIDKTKLTESNSANLPDLETLDYDSLTLALNLPTRSKVSIYPKVGGNSIKWQVEESGLAKSWSKFEMNGYYAYHNYLEVGQIVKVIHPKSNNSIFVKILGKLPEDLDTGDYIIILAPQAFQAFIDVDDSFHCRLEYVVQQE